MKIEFKKEKIKDWEPSEEIISYIKAQEGLSLETYKCKAEILTIGYGHTKDVKEGNKITIQEAEKLLQEDFEIINKKLNEKLEIIEIKDKINQNQYDAIFDLAFNCGTSSPNMILYKFSQHGNKQYYTDIEEIKKYNQYKFINVPIKHCPTYLFLFRMWININSIPDITLFNRRTKEYFLFNK